MPGERTGTPGVERVLHRCLVCGDVVRLLVGLQGLDEVPGDCTCGAETTFLKVGVHLPLWTVYKHPRDFPGEFVARLSIIRGTAPVMTKKVLVAPTIEDLRAQIPGGLTRIYWNPGDDPTIVECWL